MEQYIDKAAVVAEIKNRRDSFYSLSKSCEKGTPAKAGFYAQAQTLEGILSFLDTLETKEVDEEYNGKAMLHVLNKGVERGKREMLNKTYIWLKGNKDHPFIGCEDCCLSGFLTDEFIEEFRKAMEE